MAERKFPFTTTDPRVEVVLPVGIHVLELVVEDSAGLRSEPDRVTIIVEKQEVPVPAITGIDPIQGQQGAAVKAIIAGTNLAGATAVTFSGAGVTATILSATDTSVQVSITIAADAAPGARSFSVTTPAGTAQSPNGVAFTVVAAPALPVITGISPAEGQQGATVTADITGTDLAGATAVAFSGAGVTATIVSATPISVRVSVTIAVDAAPGPRSFSVTTPAGTAHSLIGVAFTVVAAPAMPWIEAIDPAQGQQGTTVTATITGANLAGATAVTFRGTGVTAAIVSATATGVQVKITIAARAATGARNFDMEGPWGSSINFAVTFTVMAAPALPVITGISPAEGVQGDTLIANIAGSNLAGATAVEFSGPGVEAEIGSATATNIEIKIAIASTADPGARTFTVTTATGTAASPRDVVFTVAAALAGPVITGIDPAESAGRKELDAVIHGQELPGATAVEFFVEEDTQTLVPRIVFDPTVTAKIIDARRSDRVSIRITIAASAKAGARGFTVLTNWGIARSWDTTRVFFTVTRPA